MMFSDKIIVVTQIDLLNAKINELESKYKGMVL